MAAGRPAVGTPVHVRLDDDLLATLDAWRERQGMKRAEAVRYLLGQALKVGSVDDTLRNLHDMSAEALFPEAGGDVNAMYDLVLAEEFESIAGIESDPDRPVVITMCIHRSRGHWVVVEERWASSKTKQSRLDRIQSRRLAVGKDKRDAIQIYKGWMVEVTKEFWREGEEPLWPGEGVDGDYVGYGDKSIRWRGLIPAGSIWHGEA
jgi:hypothetical protein